MSAPLSEDIIGHLLQAAISGNREAVLEAISQTGWKKDEQTQLAVTLANTSHEVWTGQQQAVFLVIESCISNYPTIRPQKFGLGSNELPTDRLKSIRVHLRSAFEIGTPNEVIFSDHPTKQRVQVTWGDLRRDTDPDFWIRCLDIRIRNFLLAQCATISTGGAYAPYPLALATLVGIGSLGEIFCGTLGGGNEHNRLVFCGFADRVSKDFAKTLQKPFKEKFAERWGTDKPESGSEVLYTFFRNSFVHGYYGKGVYLEKPENGKPPLTFVPDGTVILDPWWFYKSFSDAANAALAEMFKEQANGKLRKNALSYIGKLLE